MPVVDPAIEAYTEAHSTPEPPLLAALADETKRLLDAPGMMVGAVEGRFLQLLVFATRPRLVLEIGMFSGYSTLSMAAGLPADGRIITCELEPRHAEVAKRFIADSPFADRIEVRLGPALETVATLDGPFDLVFIDADKANYTNYNEAVLPKLSDSGLIVVDNTLWSGKVLDETDTSEDTRAIRAFNDHVAADQRAVCVQLPVRDGVTLLAKA